MKINVLFKCRGHGISERCAKLRLCNQLLYLFRFQWNATRLFPFYCHLPSDMYDYVSSRSPIEVMRREIETLESNWNNGLQLDSNVWPQFRCENCIALDVSAKLCLTPSTQLNSTKKVRSIFDQSDARIVRGTVVNWLAFNDRISIILNFGWFENILGPIAKCEKCIKRENNARNIQKQNKELL